jgi:Cu/Zn superoxide dismutase
VNVLSDGSALLNYTHEVAVADLTGHAVILHEGMDNFGNIPLGTAANQYTANSQDAITATQNTGNAGNRIACGVIQ